MRDMRIFFNMFASQKPLATNLPLFSRRLQLPIPLGLNLTACSSGPRTPPGSYILDV